jgi:hypothetical protein
MKSVFKKINILFLCFVQMSPMWCMLPKLNDCSDTGSYRLRSSKSFSSNSDDMSSFSSSSREMVQYDRQNRNKQMSKSEPSTRLTSPTQGDPKSSSHLPLLAARLPIRKSRSVQVSPKSKASFYQSSNSSSISGSLPDLEERDEPTEEELFVSDFTYYSLMEKETFELVDIFNALKYLDVYCKDIHDKDRFNDLYSKTCNELKTMIQDDRSIVSTPIDNGEKDLMSFIFTELENVSRFGDLIWLCIQKGTVSLDIPLIGSHTTLRAYLRNMNDWKFVWFVQNALQPQYAFVDRKKERALLRHIPSDVCLREAIDSLERNAH